MQPRNSRAMEPLAGYTRYQKLSDLNKRTWSPYALGFVQLAWDTESKTQVAIKFIERGEKISKYVEQKILNHKRLNHPYFVKLKEVFLTPEFLAIVMEYAAGGDMFQLVMRQKGLPEAEARWYFQQLIIAINYCHRMGVANRDIKLANTLLDGTTRPLIKFFFDYGGPNGREYGVAAPAYHAPEVIMTTKGQTFDDKIADMWSCGVMLYVMLVGAYPFERPEDKHDHHELQEVIQRIVKAKYEFPPHVKASKECWDMLTKILEPDPDKRMTLPQIQDHVWYRKDLPPGAAELNDNLPTLGSGLQTLEEIYRIMREAQTPPAGPQGSDNDESLDDTMVEENFDEWGMDASI